MYSINTQFRDFISLLPQAPLQIGKLKSRQVRQPPQFTSQQVAKTSPHTYLVMIQPWTKFTRGFYKCLQNISLSGGRRQRDWVMISLLGAGREQDLMLSRGNIENFSIRLSLYQFTFFIVSYFMLYEMKSLHIKDDKKLEFFVSVVPRRTLVISKRIVVKIWILLSFQYSPSMTMSV